MRSIAWAAAVVSVLGNMSLLSPVTAIPSEAASPMILKLATAVSTSDPYQYGAEQFKGIVEKATNNRIQVQIFPAAQLGSEREIIEGVALGTIEIGLVASAPLSGFAKPFLLFDLPFLFKDAMQARQILDGPIGEQVAKSIESKGIKLLSFNESGFRMMINSKRDVRDPKDLQGLRFRVMENPVYVAMFEALGASAVPIPFGEVYTSVGTGVVDGAEIPVNVIYANKIHEVAKHMTLTRHTYTPTPWLMNLKLFHGLSAEDQALMLRASREASAAQRALIDRKTDEFIALLKKEGVQVTVLSGVQLQQLREKVRPVYQKFEKEIGTELLQAVLKAIQ